MINCLLARKRIYAYLNDDLSDTELREFMEHVENCPECMEELKITHMVYTGAKSLDDAESGTLDFETSFKTASNPVEALSFKTVNAACDAVCGGHYGLLVSLFDFAFTA